MTFEFFAYWNGSQIRALFEAVVAITGSADYTGLLKTLVLFGFLCVITICALRYRGLEAGSFIFAVLIFYGVTLVPKTDVVINDERSGSVMWFPTFHWGLLSWRVPPLMSGIG